MAYRQATLTAYDLMEIRGRFLVLGIVSVLLGIAAIVLPQTTNLAVELILGGVLLIAGAADGAHAFALRAKRGYILDWMSATILLLVGLLLIYSFAAQQTTARAGLPDPTSLPLALGIMFVMAGALRMGKGLNLRPIRNWAWVLLSGLLGVLFGFVILWEWRTISILVIGVFAGISLIVDGWSRMAVFWLAARDLKSEETTDNV